MNQLVIRDDGKLELRNNECMVIFKGTPEELNQLEDGETAKQCRILLKTILKKIDKVKEND